MNQKRDATCATSLFTVQIRKPDSVSIPSFIWAARHRTAQTAYPPRSGGPPSIRGIFGLSAPEVYPAADVATCTGGLLPHPFTLTTPCGMAVCSLLHLLSSPARAGNAFPLGSRLPCAVRTFLIPKHIGNAMERFARQRYYTKNCPEGFFKGFEINRFNCLPKKIAVSANLSADFPVYIVESYSLMLSSTHISFPVFKMTWQ